jgi:hypothetical protein
VHASRFNRHFNNLGRFIIREVIHPNGQIKNGGVDLFAPEQAHKELSAVAVGVSELYSGLLGGEIFECHHVLNSQIIGFVYSDPERFRQDEVCASPQYDRVPQPRYRLYSSSKVPGINKTRHLFISEQPTGKKLNFGDRMLIECLHNFLRYAAVFGHRVDEFFVPQAPTQIISELLGYDPCPAAHPPRNRHDRIYARFFDKMLSLPGNLRPSHLFVHQLLNMSRHRTTTSVSLVCLLALYNIPAEDAHVGHISPPGFDIAEQSAEKRFRPLF